MFEIITNVSTASFKFFKPSAAKRPRFGPSKVNGRVTTPTVKAPKSLAILATTGAAPVPVPPPIPAVTNTKSAPSSTSRICSSLSSAAFNPISGSEPAPKPLVTFGPNWILISASEPCNA